MMAAETRRCYIMAHQYADDALVWFIGARRRRWPLSLLHYRHRGIYDWLRHEEANSLNIWRTNVNGMFTVPRHLATPV